MIKSSKIDIFTISLYKFILSLLSCVVAGTAVFVALHIFFVITWGRLFALRAAEEAWWLNTQGSVAVTLVAVFFATIGILSIFGASNLAKVPLALAMWVGILIGMYGSELTLHHSEHNMGPIPFIIGGVLTLPTVTLGALAALVLNKLVHRRTAR